jgi:N-acetylmuramoyl-L-alanine amidase
VRRFPLKFEIVTCPKWGAVAPKSAPSFCGRSVRTIFHHTAGHHRDLDGDRQRETRAECIAYARDIQRFHMETNGWNDSGHNFLVTRSGLVLQGRWKTVSRIQQRQMVVSAHCPGQNDQIGIEHEHYGNEEMTPEQKEASSMLMAWIAWHYRRDEVLPSLPHGKFFPTACPANLTEDIGGIVTRAQTLLNRANTVNAGTL